MIKITFQNKIIEVNENSHLADFLHHQGYRDMAFAVAINYQFIPQRKHTQTKLNQGDIIDIITPMQGG